MFSPHEMRSWSQGPLSIGTKYKHTVKDGVVLCSTLAGAKHFKHNYTISGEHDPAEERTMWFVIQNWDFEDGRMTYAGDEQVPANYEPHNDARWSRFKSKFTQYYAHTMTTRIEEDIMNMAARQEYSMNCDSMDGIRAFGEKLHKWLKANELPSANGKTS